MSHRSMTREQKNMKNWKNLMKELGKEGLRLITHPAFWTATALVILLAQAGYWLDISWDPDYRASDTAALFKIGASILAFWCPILGILFMTATAEEPRQHGPSPTKIVRRLPTIALGMSILPLVALLALLPASIAGNLVYAWNEIGPAEAEKWLPSITMTAKALWTGTAYASLAGLAIIITGSRLAGGLVTAGWSLLENIIMDLTTGWWESLDWIQGLLPSNMYLYWLGNPATTLGAMKNLFNLEDGTQAFLVLATHIAWASAATISIARWKNRPQKVTDQADKSNYQAAVKAEGFTIPRRRTWIVASAIVMGLVVLPAAIGTIVTANQGQPSPKTTAERYIRHNLTTMSEQVAHAVAPDHPLEKDISEEIRGAMTGSLRGYECTEEKADIPAKTELSIGCTLRATLSNPLEIHIQAPITINIRTDPERKLPKPSVAQVQVHREKIKITGPDARKTSTTYPNNIQDNPLQ